MRQLGLKSLMCGLLVLAATPAYATTYELDIDHSDVGFSVKHMMISNVRGSFRQVMGTLDLNEADVTKSTLNVTINVTSIDTHVQKRDDHLRSPDFFDATKYPNITFKSTKVQKAGKQLKVTGDLTIRDVTKPVTLLVTGPSKPTKDPFGMTRVAVNATGKLNRKDYGLGWNKALEAGGVMVGDDVAFEINAELVKKEAPKT